LIAVFCFWGRLIVVVFYFEFLTNKVVSFVLLFLGLACHEAKVAPSHDGSCSVAATKLVTLDQ